MAWYKVAEAQDGPTRLQAVRAGGKKICLIYVNKHYYATQLSCPHAGADLSAGWCAQGKLICPYHRYTYDLQTGRGGPGQGDFVKTYKVELKKGDVYVQVGSLSEKLKRWLGIGKAED